MPVYANDNMDHRAHELEIVEALRAAVAAIPNIKLVIDKRSPLSLLSLADALQCFARGGSLVLDLSNRRMDDIAEFHIGRSMWAALVHLGMLHLNLDNTRASDNVINGMVCAIEASSEHPVAWGDLNLNLSHNQLTNIGLL